MSGIALLGAAMPAIVSLAIILMCVKLKSSIEKTLYSYTNITLIGLILFCIMLLVQLIAADIRGSAAGGYTMAELTERLISFPRRFSHLAIPVIIAISLAVCVSNLVLMKREGVCPANMLGALLAAFYIGATLVLYLLSDMMESRFADSGVLRTVNSGIGLFLVTMLCYLECVFAGTCILSWAAAKHVPAFDKDYIIILGCSVDKRGGLLPLLKGRANRAIRFAWQQEMATGKPCRYVPSGGQGPNEVISEGSALELYLLSHGAEDYEVYPEKKSTSTYENMLFSKQIIDTLKPDAVIAFATTGYHILRSGILAREAGFDAEGVASETKWYFWPNGFVREFFAILAMKKSAHLKVAAVVALLCILVYVIGM